MTNWLNLLNEQQHSAVTAPLQNALIIAGAGSGKTRVLVSRIVNLVQTYGIAPHGILAVTFTNKAAHEMKTRIAQCLDVSIQSMWVGTFHGLCHRLLRRHYAIAGLPQAFRILDGDDQGRLIKRAIQALNLDLEHWPVKKAQAYINRHKDEGLRCAHVHESSYGPGKTLLKIYSTYEQLCLENGALDFAEILLRAHELLRDNPELLSHYQQRFQAILIDEFQDTNAIQYAWIRLLAEGGAKVMAVGDDDQSIYGWRGAKVENIQRFSRDFASTQVIRLEQNYRSTAVILNAANALIAHNDTRLGKDLWTEGLEGEKIEVYAALNELDEARYVADTLQRRLQEGFHAEDCAILYRSNAQSRILEEALLYKGQPYRIHGGVRYFERAEIKDMLSYLRLIANLHDNLAFERVVNFPTRGIGDKTLEVLLDYAQTNQCSLWQASIACTSDSLSQRAITGLARFRDLITSMQQEALKLDLPNLFQTVLQQSGLYRHYFEKGQDASESKQENLKELINAARQFRAEGEESEADDNLLGAFLTYASLEGGEVSSGSEGSAVSLMTLHAAKGLEFKLVFIVGMEEGLFPSPQALESPGRLEEERRLFYVGITRAMQKLVLTHAKVRRQYGREERHRASRFVAEIPDDFVLVKVPRAEYHPGSKKPLATEAKTLSKNIDGTSFYVGQWIVHNTFGRGIILNAEVNGTRTRVQVKFQEAGVKWLDLAYASIRADA